MSDFFSFTASSNIHKFHRSTTMRFWVFILLVLSTLAASYPTGSYVVHGKRDADPVGMQRVSRAPKDVPLAVQIMLKQQNLEHGARFLQDVSDPDSPNFGKTDLTDYMRYTYTLDRKILDSRANQQKVRASTSGDQHHSRLGPCSWYRKESRQALGWYVIVYRSRVIAQLTISR